MVYNISQKTILLFPVNYSKKKRGKNLENTKQKVVILIAIQVISTIKRISKNNIILYIQMVEDY